MSASREWVMTDGWLLLYLVFLFLGLGAGYCFAELRRRDR